MLRNILVLALLLLAPSPSFAEILECPGNANGDLTMPKFTQCLLDKRKGDAIVTNAIVVGVDKTGKEFTEEYASPMYNSLSAVAALIAACTTSTTLDTQPAGAFNYKWCASPSELRHAKRDKWLFQLGRWRVIEVKDYDCDVPAEYAAMPPIVKATVCD